MSPLVSVVMIFLSSQRFIIEAVESGLAQTFNDWELVLVGEFDRWQYSDCKS
jgi:glycosyltransferase involved in cell wall biosynthesis